MGSSQGGVLHDAAGKSRGPDLEADRLVPALAVSGAEAAVCSACSCNMVGGEEEGVEGRRFFPWFIYV